MTVEVETTPVAESDEPTKPSGPAAAAFVAAGIGSLVLGMMVTLNEASGRIKDAFGFDINALLQFDKNYGLGSGVGALSGKVIIAIFAYLVSWAILYFLWRRREISVRRALISTLVLTGIGFALTFPPIFLMAG